MKKKWKSFDVLMKILDLLTVEDNFTEEIEQQMLVIRVVSFN